MKIRSTFLLSAAMICGLLVAVRGAQSPSALDLYQEALHLQDVKGDLKNAIEIYRTIVDRYPADQDITSKALLEMADCYEKLGKPEAAAVYERIVHDYSSSAAATTARAWLDAVSQKGAEPVARQVWNDRGNSVFPDGRAVTFTDDSGALSIHELSPGKDRRLTAGGRPTHSYAEGGLPSPDGRQVAYAWYDGARDAYDLRVVDRDGVKTRILYSKSAKIREVPSIVGWSPDATSLLVSFVRGQAASATRDLAWVSLAAATVRQVKHFDNADARDFSLAPDGRSVGYDRPAAAGRSERDLYVMSVSDGREIPMYQAPSNDQFLGWFPDAAGVLMLSDRSGTFGIWAASVVNGRVAGEVTLIRANTGAISSIGFARQGDFFFGRRDRQDEVYLVSLDPTTGMQAGAPTSLDGRFIAGKTQLAWSPDGRRLAYVQTTTPPAALPSALSRQSPDLAKRLAIQTMATGDIRLWTLAFQNFQNPVWMPDSHAVIVQGTQLDGSQGLFRVDAETGAVTLIAVRDLTSSDTTRAQPAVSADGRLLFFKTPGIAPSTAALGQLAVRDLAAGVDRRVATDSFWTFALSPDGRWLALATGQSGSHGNLSIIPSSGGAALPIGAAGSGWDVRDQLSWTADSRNVLMVKSTADADEIWRVPVDGAAPRDTGVRWPGHIGRISAHPDGTRIAISAARYTAETWMIEAPIGRRDK